MLVKITRRLVVASLVAVLAACGSAPVAPGFYRVERGDTLSKIARSNRQSVSNLARWNSIATSISLIWPAAGTVVRSFDGGNSKGIDIANTAGTPVIAAAAGTVVYAGNGLRGYGNLLIIKHDADYLTAYAHNRVLLVKEGQAVTQGQKIAEMGDTDNDRVALHFELRYGGRSIDPSRYLPAR